MIIDAHMHIQDRKWLPNIFGEAITTIIPRPNSPPPKPHEVNPAIWHDDAEGKQWAKDYKQLGIDASVIQVVDWGSAEGWGEEAPRTIEEINRDCCELAKKYPGKLYCFVGVHPRRHNAVEILERGVKEWGAKGLKLHPAMGFYPNDRECYPLYEKCVELGVPVTIHTGWGVVNYMKYTNPVFIEEPARDFPELNIIQAHAGGGLGHLWEEAVTVARGNPNIYLELAEIAPTVIKGGRLGNAGKFKDHIPAFLDMLDIMRNLLTGGCQNIIFGTDYPFAPMETFKQWVDLFNNLPAVAAKHGYDFDQEETDMICYKNIARLLKLDVKGLK